MTIFGTRLPLVLLRETKVPACTCVQTRHEFCKMHSYGSTECVLLHIDIYTQPMIVHNQTITLTMAITSVTWVCVFPLLVAVVSGTVVRRGATIGMGADSSATGKMGMGMGRKPNDMSTGFITVSGEAKMGLGMGRKSSTSGVASAPTTSAPTTSAPTTQTPTQDVGPCRRDRDLDAFLAPESPEERARRCRHVWHGHYAIEATILMLRFVGFALHYFEPWRMCADKCQSYVTYSCPIDKAHTCLEI